MLEGGEQSPDHMSVWKDTVEMDLCKGCDMWIDSCEHDNKPWCAMKASKLVDSLSDA
jgi:hypothetical protein